MKYIHILIVSHYDCCYGFGLEVLSLMCTSTKFAYSPLPNKHAEIIQKKTGLGSNRRHHVANTVLISEETEVIADFYKHITGLSL